jgi:hypothetical protein
MALYGLPDFDDVQRLESLALSETGLITTLNKPLNDIASNCRLEY